MESTTRPARERSSQRSGDPASDPDLWRPHNGLLTPDEVRRALAEHPAWTLAGGRLERELRFTDFREAFRFVEQLADVQDFGRHPDLCIIGGNCVRLTIADPNHAGVTAGDLRLLRRLDAAAGGAGGAEDRARSFASARRSSATKSGRDGNR